MPAWPQSKFARGSTPQKIERRRKVASTNEAEEWDRIQKMDQRLKETATLDIPKTGTGCRKMGTFKKGHNSSLNFHSAQKKSREPAAAMMADNEGKNIAMAPSVPGGTVGVAAMQHVD